MLTMCFTQASLVQLHWELSVLKTHVDFNLSPFESHVCSVIYCRNKIKLYAAITGHYMHEKAGCKYVISFL